MIYQFLLTAICAQNAIQRQNGQDALKLDNLKQQNIEGSSCSNPGDLCVQDKVGQCVDGKIIVTASCGPTLQCQVLPLVNKRGTTVTCDTESDKIARFQQAGVPMNSVIGSNSPEVTILPPTQDQPLVINQNVPAPVPSCTCPQFATQTPQIQTPVPVVNEPNTKPKNVEQRKANTFECIDDTQFKLFTSNSDFIVQSCPKGQCFTRKPPNKNPCVGKANAQRIDGI